MGQTVHDPFRFGLRELCIIHGMAIPRNILNAQEKQTI